MTGKQNCSKIFHDATKAVMGRQAADRILKKIKKTADNDPQKLGFLLRQYGVLLDYKAKQGLTKAIGKLQTAQVAVANHNKIIGAFSKLKAAEVVNIGGAPAAKEWAQLVRGLDPTDSTAVTAAYEKLLTIVDLTPRQLTLVEKRVHATRVFDAMAFGDQAYTMGGGYTNLMALRTQEFSKSAVLALRKEDMMFFMALQDGAEKTTFFRANVLPTVVDAFNKGLSDGSGAGDIGLLLRQSHAFREDLGVRPLSAVEYLADLLSDTNLAKLPANLEDQLIQMSDKGLIDLTHPSLNPEAATHYSLQRKLVNVFKTVSGLDNRKDRLNTSIMPNLAKAADKTMVSLGNIYARLNKLDSERALLEIAEKRARTETRVGKLDQNFKLGTERLLEITEELRVEQAVIEKYNDEFGEADVAGAKSNLAAITKERNAAKRELDKLNTEYIGIANKLAKQAEGIANLEDGDVAAIANSFGNGGTPRELYDGLFNAQTNLKDSLVTYQTRLANIAKNEQAELEKVAQRAVKTDDMVNNQQLALAERDKVITKYKGQVEVAQANKAAKVVESDANVVAAKDRVELAQQQVTLFKDSLTGDPQIDVSVVSAARKTILDRIQASQAKTLAEKEAQIGKANVRRQKAVDVRTADAPKAEAKVTALTSELKLAKKEYTKTNKQIKAGKKSDVVILTPLPSETKIIKAAIKALETRLAAATKAVKKLSDDVKAADDNLLDKTFNYAEFERKVKDWSSDKGQSNVDYVAKSVKEANDEFDIAERALKTAEGQRNKLDTDITAKQKAVTDAETAKGELITEQARVLTEREQRLADAKKYVAPEIDNQHEALLRSATEQHEGYGLNTAAEFEARQTLAMKASDIEGYLPPSQATLENITPDVVDAMTPEQMAKKGFVPLTANKQNGTHILKMDFIGEDGKAVPSNVLIDTGAFTSFGSDALLGKRAGNTRLVNDVRDAQLSNLNIKSEGIQLKGTALSLLKRADSAPNMDVTGLMKSAGVEAIIGRDILTNYDMVYTPSGAYLGKKGAVKPAGDTFFVKGNNYSIDLFGERTLVDSGATSTHLRLSTIEELGGVKIGTRGVTTASGKQTLDVYKVPELTIGSNVYKDVEVVPFAEGENLGRNIIGSNILNQGNVVLTKTKVIFGAVDGSPKVKATPDKDDTLMKTFVERALALKERPEGMPKADWDAFDNARMTYLEKLDASSKSKKNFDKVKAELDAMLEANPGDATSALHSARNSAIRNTLEVFGRTMTKQEKMQGLSEQAFQSRRVQAAMMRSAERFIDGQNTAPAAVNYVQALQRKGKLATEQTGLQRVVKHAEERLPIMQKRLDEQRIAERRQPGLSQQTSDIIRESMVKAAAKLDTQAKSMADYQKELDDLDTKRAAAHSESANLTNLLSQNNINDPRIAANALAKAMRERGLEAVDAGGDSTRNLLNTTTIPVKGMAGLNAWLESFGDNTNPITKLMDAAQRERMQELEIEQFGSMAGEGLVNMKQSIGDIAGNSAEWRSNLDLEGWFGAKSFISGVDSANTFFKTNMTNKRINYNPTLAKGARSARAVARTAKLSLSFMSQVLDRVPQVAAQLANRNVARAVQLIVQAPLDMVESFGRGAFGKGLSEKHLAQMLKDDSTMELFNSMMGAVGRIDAAEDGHGVADALFASLYKFTGVTQMNALGSMRSSETASRLIASAIRKVVSNPDRIYDIEIRNVFEPFGLLPDDIFILAKGIDEGGIFRPELVPDLGISTKAKAMHTFQYDRLTYNTLGGNHASAAGIGTQTGTIGGEGVRMLTMLTTFPRIFAGQVVPSLIREMGGRNNVAGSAMMMGGVMASALIMGMMRDAMYEVFTQGKIITNGSNMAAVAEGRLEDIDAGQNVLAAMKYMTQAGMLSAIPSSMVSSWIYGFTDPVDSFIGAPFGMIRDAAGSIGQATQGRVTPLANTLTGLAPFGMAAATTVLTRSPAIGAGVGFATTAAMRSRPIGQLVGNATGSSDFEYGMTKAFRLWANAVIGKDYDMDDPTILEDVFGTGGAVDPFPNGF